jgi:hypothetical protein
MTDSQALIPLIKAALTDLKAGDANAITRLQSILGGTSSITVGDIEHSKAVAIGNNIRIVINEQTLPPDILNGLQAIFDLLRRDPEIKARIEQQHAHHIFLSYSRHNMELARQIRTALEAAGHHVWQDVTTITGGQEWIRSIEEGIERAYAVVTVVSEEANSSEWVQIAYLHANRRGKFVVPIKIDDSEIPTETSLR